MVRLREERIQMQKTTILEFQFHYGTIKRNINNKRKVQSRVFQFHYGTIKRMYGYEHLKDLADFNSTMVRLRGLNFEGKTVDNLNFNSTMVRLRVRYFYPLLHRHRIFQFHYGTIKSQIFIQLLIANHNISIPLWYD